MQIKEVAITRVFSGTKETKFGVKPTVAIKTTEYGDKWISTFKVTPEMKEWKEGDKVTLNIEEKNGFMNFNIPEGDSANTEIRLTKLEKAVFGDSSSNEKVIDLDDSEDVTPKGSDDFDF